MTCVWEFTLECKKYGTPTEDGEVEFSTVRVIARTFAEAVKKAEQWPSGYQTVAVFGVKKLYHQVIE
jgi:hypothetical protein